MRCRQGARAASQRDAGPKWRRLARRPPSLSRHAARLQKRQVDGCADRIYPSSGAASGSAASSALSDCFDLREPRDDFLDPGETGAFEPHGDADAGGWVQGSGPALEEPKSETEHAANITTTVQSTSLRRFGQGYVSSENCLKCFTAIMMLQRNAGVVFYTRGSLPLF